MRSCEQLMTSGGGGISLFKGLTPARSSTLYCVAPHLGVYGQNKLDSTSYEKGNEVKKVVGWGGFVYYLSLIIHCVEC